MNNIELISDDTNYLDENDIFIAKKGKNINVNNLINLALNKNPKEIISNVKNKKVKYIFNLKKYENKIIKNYKINPIIIGVTGTNGKTSTTTIIFNILKSLNKDVMLIGTNGVFYKDLKFKNRNTTPSKLSILYLINKYLSNNSFLVIELSSQSYQRIKDIKIDYLIYTNLSSEHLDYHKTMNKYFKAKLRIIKNLKDKSNLFINIDDKYGLKLLKRYPNAHKYSLNDLIIKSLNPIKFIYKNREYMSKLSIKFNIYNIYSAVLLVNKLTNEEDKIIESIKDINYIDGRNNIINYKDNKIIIDYAHTPFSIENILEYYSSIKHNNIYVLIGFGGNRDKEKRFKMVQSILKYTNNIVISEDNNRNECFIDIIKSTLKEETNNLIIIQNRKEAIRYCINKLISNDYLLILGKGNEEYMIKNNEYIKYSDYEEVIKWII